MASIGIIITVYNKEKYLGRAIESVARQTRLPDELVIVNDCSTDNSHNIIQSYIGDLESRIKSVKYINSESNQGASESRNKALNIIESDFIVFLDADDSYDSDYIRSLDNLAHKDTGMIVSRVKMESNGLIYPSDKVKAHLLSCNNNQITIPKPFEILSKESLFVGGGNVCFRRSLMGKERFVAGEKAMEEWDFYYRILKKLLCSGMNFVFNNHIGYLYNDIDENSLSRKKLLSINAETPPVLIERISDENESGYRSLISSIWLLSVVNRCRYRDKFKFLWRQKKVLRYCNCNRYLIGIFVNLIFPDRIFTVLKDIRKKIWYRK